MVNTSPISQSGLKIREIIVSAIINGAISVGFFLTIFANLDPIPVRGIGAYAFDFLPQSFAIGFFAWFVPAFIVRRAAAKAQVQATARADANIARIFAGALLAAIVSLAAGACLPAGILWFSGMETIGFAPAFAWKVLYGAALGAIVTRFMLGWLFTTPTHRSASRPGRRQ